MGLNLFPHLSFSLFFPTPFPTSSLFFFQSLLIILKILGLSQVHVAAILMTITIFCFHFYNICFESLRKYFKEKVLHWGKQVRWGTLSIGHYFRPFSNSLCLALHPRVNEDIYGFSLSPPSLFPHYIRCQRLISEQGMILFLKELTFCWDM